jgi:hypothetical protein
MARLFCLLIFIFILGPAALAKTEKTNHKTSDADIAQLLIDESINNYSGNCPCPYNHAKMVVAAVNGVPIVVSAVKAHYAINLISLKK